jgi:hypothetical protein
MINNFKYAISLAQMLYDIDINDMDTLIEIGLVAYNFIGNKHTKLSSEIVNVDQRSGLVKLPCKADLVEAITYPSAEDWSYTSNTQNFGDYNTLNIEQYIEKSKQSVDPLYISGKFVKYRREGNYIYVNEKVDKVCVLYHTETLDEDDLPLINDKEAVAIADYIAYTVKYKEALRSNNSAVFQMAQTIKRQWLIHCDAARVPEYVNQNEMNDLLEVMSSHNRKVHGRSYKPTV